LTNDGIESGEHFLPPDVIHQFDIVGEELLVEQEVPDVPPLHPEPGDVLGFLVQSQVQNPRTNCEKRTSSHLIADALSHGRLDVGDRREQTVGDACVQGVHGGGHRFQGLDIGRQSGEVALQLASDGDQQRSDCAQVLLDGLDVRVEFYFGLIEHGVNGVIVGNLAAKSKYTRRFNMILLPAGKFSEC
jgi:hypothetical protein